MRPEPLRVAVLGMGVVGKRRHRALAARPELARVATADTPAAAAALIEGKGPAVDAVVVCVPNDQAPPLCRRALERGLDVFCEKPPARSTAELLPVIAAGRVHRRVLMFGFNHRHHGSVRALLDGAAAGRFGRLQTLRGVYEKTGNTGWRLDPRVAGGGILLDQGIHLLDLMLALAPDLHPVHARVRGAPVDDDVHAILEDPAGVVATLHSSARAPRCRFALDAVFSRARVTLDGILSGSMAYAPERLAIAWAPGAAPAGAVLDEHGHEEAVFTEDHSWAAGMAAFLAAVAARRGGGPAGAGVLSGGAQQHGRPEAALRVLRGVEAIYALGRS